MRSFFMLVFGALVAGCAVESSGLDIQEQSDGTSRVESHQMKEGGSDCPNSGPGVYIYECPPGVIACVQNCDNTATCKDTCLTTQCGCKLKSADPAPTSGSPGRKFRAPIDSVKGVFTK